MKKYILPGLLGFGISVACIILPPIHWVTGPLSPFIGGFVGGMKARAPWKGAMVIGLMMGTCLCLFLTGLFFLLITLQVSGPAGIVEKLQSGEFSGKSILGGVFSVVTTFGTLSARAGGKIAEKAEEV